MRKYRLTLLFREINSRIILLNQELTYLCENVVDENRKLSFHNIRKRAESICEEVCVLSKRAQMIYDAANGKGSYSGSGNELQILSVICNCFEKTHYLLG